MVGADVPGGPRPRVRPHGRPCVPEGVPNGVPVGAARGNVSLPRICNFCSAISKFPNLVHPQSGEF